MHRKFKDPRSTHNGKNRMFNFLILCLNVKIVYQFRRVLSKTNIDPGQVPEECIYQPVIFKHKTTKEFE